MKVSQKKIANLEVLDVEGDGDIIILLHGYGANKEDLFPLHKYLQVPKNTRWIFPDAPNELDFGNFIGRAWFPLVASNIEYINQGLDFSEIKPKGLIEANQMINELIETLNVPMNKIYLGGFSQGAMLSTDVVLRNKENPKGLIVLSGTLVNSNEWKELAKLKSGLEYFQSHGKQDPILPFKAAEKLNSLFKDSLMKGDFISFNGGHEIPDLVCKELVKFLN